MYRDAGVLDLDLGWFQRRRGEEAHRRTRSDEELPFVAIELPPIDDQLDDNDEAIGVTVESLKANILRRIQCRS